MDFLATEPHFIDHLAPIWRAMEERGAFWVGNRALLDRARRRGVAAIPGWPTVAAPTLIASYGDLKRLRLLPHGPIAFIEHGAGQTYGFPHQSYPGGPDRDDISLFLTPSERVANLWRAAYPAATAVVVGSPHVADLPSRDNSLGPTVTMSFHPDFDRSPEMRSAWQHYRRDLPLLLGQDWTILGHAHPRFLDTATRFYRRLGIETVGDFEDVCRRTDLYVCDNSSSIFEFAATGRPVVLLNAPWYRRDQNLPPRFWSEADVGVQVDQPTELVERINYALTDPPEIKVRRAAAVSRVYGKPAAEAPAAAVAALRAWSGVA